MGLLYWMIIALEWFLVRFPRDETKRREKSIRLRLLQYSLIVINGY